MSLTTEQRQQLEQQGFVAFPDFMSAELLHDMRQRVSELYEIEGDRAGHEIGIGGSLSDCAPPTPPGMRVRTGRFEKLRS